MEITTQKLGHCKKWLPKYSCPLTPKLETSSKLWSLKKVQEIAAGSRKYVLSSARWQMSCAFPSASIYSCLSSVYSKLGPSWQGILKNKVPKLPATAVTRESAKRNKNTTDCKQTVQHREPRNEQRKRQAYG